MGYEKDRQIQEWDQGWYFSDSTICFRCLTDPVVREIVKDNADQSECSFCDRRRKNTAVDFDVVMRYIAETARQYFGTVNEEGLGRDQEDERYFGTTYDSREVIEDLGPPSNNEVIDEIVECLGDETWCDRHPYSITGVDRYDSSWDEFCDTVKHKIRYFFGDIPAEEYSETIPMSQMLDALRSLIEGADLIQVLDAGSA
jgi:hypothetical protein